MAVEYEISSDVATIKDVAPNTQVARVVSLYSGQITYDDEASSKFATATIDGKSQRVMLCIAVNGTVNYDDVPCLYSTVDGHRCLNIVAPTETGTPDDVPSLCETVVIDGMNVRAVRCILINETPIYDGVSSTCTFVANGKTHTAQLVNQITGGAVDVIIKGVAPLSLPDAIANSLHYVKAFGGTEQGGVPTGYKALNGITNGSGTYVDTGITPAVDDVEIEIRVKPTTGSWYILQSRQSGGPIWGVSGSSSGSKILLGWAGTGNLCQSAIVRDTTHTYYIKATLNNGTATLYVKDETSNTDDTQTNTYTSAVPTLPFWLYGNQNTDRVAAGNTVYMARVKVGGVTVMDYVPALNPSMVVGFYDKTTGNFKVSNEGTLTADQTIVPTPTAPIDIVCNNGVLKPRHQSGLPLGYTLLEYIGGTGTQYIETDTKIASTDIIETEFQNSSATGYGALYGIYNTGESSAFYANQTYYGYDAANNKVNTNVSVDTDWHTAVHNFVAGTLTLDGNTTSFTPFEYTNTVNNGILARYYGGSYGYFFKGKIRKFKVVRNGVIISNMVPVKDSTDTPGMYDLVSDTFFTNAGTGNLVAGNPVSDPVEVYTTGPIETIAIKDDQSATVSTATCEDLLSVGDYTDEQEIISGAVTRNVGVKVLDGTERFTVRQTQSGIATMSLSDCPRYAGSSEIEFIVSHFIFQQLVDGGSKTSGKPIGFYAYYSDAQPSTRNWYFNVDATLYPTADDFKQFLAAQYNAGTPVIIVYPLATATTESVAGQTLQVDDGDNTIEITQASLTGLQLEAKYKAAVELTVQEVQDANLDPNVEVTIH